MLTPIKCLDVLDKPQKFHVSLALHFATLAALLLVPHQTQTGPVLVQGECWPQGCSYRLRPDNHFGPPHSQNGCVTPARESISRGSRAKRMVPNALIACQSSRRQPLAICRALAD